MKSVLSANRYDSAGLLSPLDGQFPLAFFIAETLIIASETVMDSGMPQVPSMAWVSESGFSGRWGLLACSERVFSWAGSKGSWVELGSARAIPEFSVVESVSSWAERKVSMAELEFSVVESVSSWAERKVSMAELESSVVESVSSWAEFFLTVEEWGFSREEFVSFVEEFISSTSRRGISRRGQGVSSRRWLLQAFPS